MSLLLDALKRAEQEKLTRQGDAPPGPGERPPAVPPSPAGPAGLELQPMGTPAAANSSLGPRPDAAQAAQVFKAKTAAEPEKNRGALWAAIAAIVVVVIAAGAYVWYSIRSIPIARPAASAHVRPAPFVPPPAAPGAALPQTLPAPAVAPAPEPVIPVEAAAAAPKASTPAAAPASPLDELLKGSPRAAAPAPVQLVRTEEEKPRVPPQVQEGYDALVAGDLATAHKRYEAALDADPANLDAVLGLATVEARAGNGPAAAAAYRRALALDPQNATALAGLAALADDARPEALEDQLRADLALHPDSAALQLTLGNLYASQRRWADAQAAYFEAHRLQPENADIAYNLAVSLDHLGQRRPAADFYRRALETRRGNTAQFDAAAAARRLAELSR